MSTITNLLKAVHNFYPVGLNTVMTNYDGFEEFREILNNKIQVVMDKTESPWTRLRDKIGEIFPDHVILDQSYNQFPSYQIYINLFTKEYDELKYEQSLILNISLLCPYYTVFNETKIEIKRPGKNTQPALTSRFLSLFNTNNFSKEGLQEINGLIEQCFPRYQFVHHKFLFDSKIEGCGHYGNWQEYETGNKYPVYLYLFDSHILIENVTVSE